MNEFEKWLKEYLQFDDTEANLCCKARGQAILKKYQSLTKDKIVLVLDKEEYEKRLTFNKQLDISKAIDKLVKLEDLIEKQL